MKKYRISLFIAGLAVLLLTHPKIVMPLVYDIIKSDLFLVDSKDKGSQLPISTPLTDLAFTHCNSYIKSRLSNDTSAIFPNKPSNAWSLGNYQYVINAEIIMKSPTGTNTKKKYVCRITYQNGDDTVGANDFNNWSIDGLSALERN